VRAPIVPSPGGKSAAVSANVAAMDMPEREVVEPLAPSEEESRADLREHYDIELVRAPNPGPLTLTGTNSWVVGRRPAWVVDPGPLIEEHLKGLFEKIEEREGLGGVILTHDHHDHSESARALVERFPAPIAAGRGNVDLALREGKRLGPFTAIFTPGHAADHYALVADGACFTGDAVLGNGSVFISPYKGAMTGYLLALTRLRLREDFNVLCPGHGPPVWDAQSKLEEYAAHRIDRENLLIVALYEGARTIEEMLDAVWSDVPAQLRPVAAATLAAHLDKLEEEQVLPLGVERPRFERTEW
jgi:glyoxylase-like metal-dependent hydrolase (beta-lactamase superfamily II)